MASKKPVKPSRKKAGPRAKVAVQRAKAAPAKRAARKAAGSKTGSKTTRTIKAATKRAPSARKSTGKAAAKKVSSRRAAAKGAARKSSSRKSPSKSPARKPPSRKSPVSKTPSRKSSVKKPPAGRAPNGRKRATASASPLHAGATHVRHEAAPTVKSAPAVRGASAMPVQMMQSTVQTAMRQSMIIDTANRFRTGDMVTHKVFGPGRVLAVEGYHLQISFKKPLGTKTIVDSFVHPARR